MKQAIRVWLNSIYSGIFIMGLFLLIKAFIQFDFDFLLFTIAATFIYGFLALIVSIHAPIWYSLASLISKKWYSKSPLLLHLIAYLVAVGLTFIGIYSFLQYGKYFPRFAFPSHRNPILFPPFFLFGSTSLVWTILTYSNSSRIQFQNQKIISIFTKNKRPYNL